LEGFVVKSLGYALIGVVLMLVHAHAVPAGTPRTLDWEDLAPSMDDLAKRFDHLTDEQLGTLNEIYSLKQWRQVVGDKVVVSDSVKEDIAELEESLQAQNLDVDDLLVKFEAAMSEYKQRSSQPVRALDDKDVRLPGYVLPLEFNGTAVSEFFLVPYVGACIHTPPPPANQIVLVKLNQTYKPDGLYEPVWVTGKMKIVKSQHELGYKDGVGSVTSTYRLDGVRIAPFK